MSKLINFLSYHNAVPIALGILFLGAGGALAASPAAQQAVYSSEVLMQSVDNTRIVAVDLDQYPFTLAVVAVTEDEQSYFVDYTLDSVELVNGVWQDVRKTRTLTVAKALLGGRDLGVFATQQLAEVRDHERARLKDTQTIEQKLGASQKVVATVYSGLVGAMLDPTTETFPTYRPVIETPVLTVINPVEGTPLVSSDVAGAGAGSSGVSSPALSGDTEPPALSLVGLNPTRIPLNTNYKDEGAIATDNSGVPNVVIQVDGKTVTMVQLDTSRVRAYIITYRATDASGNTAAIIREVVVDGEGPAVPTPPPAVVEPEPAPIPTSESEIAPIPDPVPEPELTPESEPEPVPVPVPEVTPEPEPTPETP